MPNLVAPEVALHEAFLAAIEEPEPEPGRRWVHPASWSPYDVRQMSEFAAYVAQLQREAVAGIHLPDGWVPHTTLWWVEGGELLGILDIRHDLTAALREVGGHIGYGVRPSARRQGHGTAMLRAALPAAHRLGLNRVLITCDEDNAASVRVIERNGGVLQDRSGGKRRYWVPTAPDGPRLPST